MIIFNFSFPFSISDDTIVEEVQVAYDVSKLSWLDQKRENSRRARIYCESHAAKHGAGQQMKPCTCGIICSACNCNCCANATDALTFYKKEESDYISEVEREKARVKTKASTDEKCWIKSTEFIAWMKTSNAVPTTRSI